MVAGLDLPTLPQQVVNGLLLGSIYALIALGYTMVYGVLRLINFAHGEVYMLGAYIALFGSYWLGFGAVAGLPWLSPAALTASASPALVVGLIGLGIFLALRIALRRHTWPGYLAGVLGFFGLAWFAVVHLQPQASNLVLMLVASMSFCALVGVIIERFAYRPMRSHSRIASLITAIGVSLLLQYGAALFLPVSPPPSIAEEVNPYRGAMTATIVPPPSDLVVRMEQARPAFDAARNRFDAYLQETGADRFNLPAEGLELRREMQDAEREFQTLSRQVDTAGIGLTVQTGQLIMFVTALVLMLILRHLVLHTSAGRAMRAASHDFDSAALMGINVNSVVTITFVIGSALAGAAAMMTATFLGTPLTTFYGLMPGVKAFVAAVLGGIGNIPGAVLGGLLMGVAETMVVWAGYSQYRDAMAFVILIAVLMLFPGGLLGSAKVEKV
jgi:branched-chain amino acid transport system permease protein